MTLESLPGSVTAEDAETLELRRELELASCEALAFKREARMEKADHAETKDALRSAQDEVQHLQCIEKDLNEQLAALKGQRDAARAEVGSLKAEYQRDWPYEGRDCKTTLGDLVDFDCEDGREHPGNGSWFCLTCWSRNLDEIAASLGCDHNNGGVLSAIARLREQVTTLTAERDAALRLRAQTLFEEIAKERESCAQLANWHLNNVCPGDLEREKGYRDACADLETAIRARRGKP